MIFKGSLGFLKDLGDFEGFGVFFFGILFCFSFLGGILKVSWDYLGFLFLRGALGMFSFLSDLWDVWDRSRSRNSHY